LVYNEATGNFDYDTAFFDYEEDVHAPTAAFDWTDLDGSLPMTVASVSGDYYTSPALSPRSPRSPQSINASSAMLLGPEVEAFGGNVSPNGATKTSNLITSRLSHLHSKLSGGRSLSLSSLKAQTSKYKDKDRDTSRTAPSGSAPSRSPLTRDVAAANRSWSDAYHDGVWGEDGAETLSEK
jgi:hypothetical protein